MARLTRRTFLEIGGAVGAGALLSRPAHAQLVSYDDGNLAIPGGSAGSLERVIVIGAGFSGLVVANAMHAAGVPAVVVEGRSRLGGRISTQSIGGVPLDLGAAWVHGTIANPVAGWAAQVGVPLTPFDISDGDLSGYDALTTLSIPSAVAGAAFGMAQDFLFELDALRFALGSGASVLDGIIQHLNNEGFVAGSDERRIIEFLIRTGLVELDYTGSAADISLDWYSEDLEFFGGDAVPVGGYETLVNALNDQLDIRLNETGH